MIAIKNEAYNITMLKAVIVTTNTTPKMCSKKEMRATSLEVLVMMDEGRTLETVGGSTGIVDTVGHSRWTT